jgi:hypothetical protein
LGSRAGFACYISQLSGKYLQLVGADLPVRFEFDPADGEIRS